MSSFYAYLTDEDNLHIATLRLVEWQFPEMKAHHSPNEGKRTKFESFKIKIMGVKAGFPDLEILYCGFSLYLELKVPGNEPTDLQFEWLEWLRENGFYAQWADNLDDVYKIIKDFKDWVDGQRRERVQTPEIRKRREKKKRTTSAPTYRGGKSPLSKLRKK